MNNRLLIIFAAVILLLGAVVAVFPSAGFAGDIPRISIEQLNRKLGAENLVIIDSRSGSDWRGSEFMIKGAVRGKAGQESKWAAEIPRDSEIVVYCA